MTEPRDEARDGGLGVLAGVLQDHVSLNHGPLSCGLSCAHPVLAALAARGYRLSPQPEAAGDVEALAAELHKIEQDAGWLHDNAPDYSPDGVATLRDIARTIAQTAYQVRAALRPADPSRREP